LKGLPSWADYFRTLGAAHEEELLCVSR
jgi:hypothetical protein